MTASATEHELAEQRLRQAVDALYDTFSAVSPPALVGDPPHEFIPLATPEPARVNPVRQYSMEEMEELAWHSFFYEGQQEQALHYWLPRLLDVASELPSKAASCGFGRSHRLFDLDFIFSDQMRVAKWREWPERELAAFTEWKRRWWATSLAFPTTGWDAWHPVFFSPLSRDAGRILTELADGGIDVDDLLQYWAAQHSFPALRELTRFVDSIVSGSGDRDRLHRRASNREEPHRSILAWLVEPQRIDQLEEARTLVVREAASLADEKALLEQTRIDDALVQAIRWLRTARVAPPAGL